MNYAETPTSRQTMTKELKRLVDLGEIDSAEATALQIIWQGQRDEDYVPSFKAESGDFGVFLPANRAELQYALFWCSRTTKSWRQILRELGLEDLDAIIPTSLLRVRDEIVKLRPRSGLVRDFEEAFLEYLDSPEARQNACDSVEFVVFGATAIAAAEAIESGELVKFVDEFENKSRQSEEPQ